MLQICKRFLRIIEILVSSGRNPILFHQILGKCLGSLQNRRISAGSEDSKPLPFKHIHNTTYQRIVHADHGQINLFFPGKDRQLLKLHGPDRHALRIFLNPCIAGRTVDFFRLRALSRLPGYGMLPSA